MITIPLKQTEGLNGAPTHGRMVGDGPPAFLDGTRTCSSNDLGERNVTRTFMDNDNPVVRLCAEGMSLEAQGNPAEAARKFAEAWQMASDDFEASIAAHYVARHQSTPGESLRWNRLSLDRANLVSEEKVRSFYPSLYLNMGKAHEDLNDPAEAARFYRLAEGACHVLSDDRYGNMVRDAVGRGLERLAMQPTDRKD